MAELPRYSQCRRKIRHRFAGSQPLIPIFSTREIATMGKYEAARDKLKAGIGNNLPLPDSIVR